MVYYMIMALIQMAMLICLFLNMAYNPQYQLFVSEDLEIIIIKFACGTALHFMLFPEINQGM
jgi:hypothetical protein